MTILEDAIRPFWVQGLNDISGHVVKGLGGWIRDEDFQIYVDVQPDSFVLSVAEPHPLLSAFSADLSRLATASLESAVSVARVEALPRSVAWTIIKSYYAAFFAAHSILRMLGLSISRLDGNQITSVNKVARAFGTALQPASKGHYCCAFDSPRRELTCTKLDLGSGGSHEAFWSVFNSRLTKLSADVLALKSGAIADNQIASAKLSELSRNLCENPSRRGGWLSFMRNEVNYSQRWGAWYPYEGHQAAHHDQLHFRHSIWTENPLMIDLTSYDGRDLLRFQQTCHFLVALCRVLVIDMARRCSTGNSFQTYGPLAVLRLIAQPPGPQRARLAGG